MGKGECKVVNIRIFLQGSQLFYIKSLMVVLRQEKIKPPCTRCLEAST